MAYKSRSFYLNSYWYFEVFRKKSYLFYTQFIYFSKVFGNKN